MRLDKPIELIVRSLAVDDFLSREMSPDKTPGEVLVRAVYPGATAEEVEEVVCQRVEEAIEGLRFVKEIRSDARQGVAMLVAEMECDGDFTSFLADVQSVVDAIDFGPKTNSGAETPRAK